MDQLSVLFREHQLRLTNARKQVFYTLQHADKPLSIRQIITSCSAADRTSVYRTLELFVSLGIVLGIPTGWKTRYELAEPFRPHHHHLQCAWCGEVIAIELPELEDQIRKFARQHHYTLSSHHIELHGVCAHCASLSTQ